MNKREYHRIEGLYSPSYARSKDWTWLVHTREIDLKDGPHGSRA